LQQIPSDTDTVNTQWVRWIKDNAHPLLSLTSEDFGDLQFLKPLLEERRLVQLGEDSHGTGSYTDVKVRLIKFLHEEMGFDVIAFESSLFACFSANDQVQEIPAVELMQYAIFRVWHTRETSALFEYLERTREDGRPLILAGFDPRFSSWEELRLRAELFENVVGLVDEQYATEVAALESRLQFAVLPGAPQEEWIQLESEYSHLVDFLDQHEAELVQAYGGSYTIPLAARQTAWSTVQHMIMNQVNAAQGILIRDKAMADNIDFLMERLYPDEKVIVWAHDYHIRHDQGAIDGLGNNMGTWVAMQHRPELYTVGLHAYRGTGANNDRSPYEHGPAASGTMERLLHDAGLPILFLDMLNAIESDSTSWMFQTITAMSWGTINFEMVPRDQYDAVLFIDEIHPPHYVN
jgi:erythromycin esterase